MDKRYIGLGMALGLIFGAAADHIGLGFTLGLVIGVAVSAVKGRLDGQVR